MLLIQQQELSTEILHKPNTFIGGVGATSVTSATDLASITTLTTAQIKNFNIDSDNNVSFYTDTSYNINLSAFKNDTDITYYIDLDGYVDEIGGVYSGNGVFSNATSLRVGIFPNATFCNIECFTYDTIDILSIPNIAPIGTNTSYNSVFLGSTVKNLYTNSVNETNNGGNPDGDLTIGSPIANINYSTNSTNPSSITDLIVDNTSGTGIDISWTVPSSTNTIQFYLIFVDDYYYGYSSTNSFSIANLSLSTSYRIRVISIDEMGNVSDFSNSVTQTTLSDYQIPTGNIISYWNFDSNSNDQVGSNDGTDTSVTYTSGYISNSATFNGSSSHIQIPYSSDLQFGSVGGDLPFSISLVAKTSSTSDQIIINDLTSGNRKFLLYYVGRKLMFRLDTGGGSNYIQVVTNNNIDLTSFTSIVAIYDGSESETGLSLIIDGVVVSQTQSQTGTYTGMPIATTNIEIGKHGDPSTSSIYWNGQIDETSIFDIELTPAQASDIYAKNQAGQYLTE